MEGQSTKEKGESGEGENWRKWKRRVVAEAEETKREAKWESKKAK